MCNIYRRRSNRWKYRRKLRKYEKWISTDCVGKESPIAANGQCYRFCHARARAKQGKISVTSKPGNSGSRRRGRELYEEQFLARLSFVGFHKKKHRCVRAAAVGCDAQSAAPVGGGKEWKNSAASSARGTIRTVESQGWKYKTSLGHASFQTPPYILSPARHERHTVLERCSFQEEPFQTSVACSLLPRNKAFA